MGVASGAVVAILLLDRRVERLALLSSLRLCLEVTSICLALSFIPVYLAFRQRRIPRLPQAALAIAVLSLLVPTLARSLGLSALFSYYGPLAGLMRSLKIWPEDQPLDSSHFAVVVALVTLYLPIALLFATEAVRGLGRLPSTAAQLGAGPLMTLWRVVLPTLSRSMLTTGLIVFAQTLGVIVTPRILGSREVTLPMLIDDLLKRELNTPAALRVALAEMVLALPIAVVAAVLLRQQMKQQRREAALGESTAIAGAPLALVSVLLAFVPLVLLVLSLVDAPVLVLDPTSTNGWTGGWYSTVWTSAAWRRLLVSSLVVGGTAAAMALSAGLGLAWTGFRRERVRGLLQAFCLVLLFLPHNVIGVVLGATFRELSNVTAWVPDWLLGSLGQAVPAFAITTLILDRSLQRLQGPLKAAASLGASSGQRLRWVALPALVPSLVTSVVATALISLDDVIFVRYLPLRSVDTIATELFARARYSASPELAALCVILLGATASIAGLGFYLAARRRSGTRDRADAGWTSLRTASG